MAYTLDVFGSSYAGGEALPRYEGEHPIGSGAVPSSMVDLPGGGAWDWRQSGNAVPTYDLITVRGEWVAASTSAMETKLNALKAMKGTRKYLWRSNDGGTTNHYRLARCLDVRASVLPGAASSCIIEIDFELYPGLWSGAVHSETTVIDAASHAVATTNGGNETVRNAVITVTAKVATITLVSFYIAGVLHWHYTGTIGINKQLVVNCGTKTVLNDGTGDYDHFGLQSDHATADWVPLAAGLNTITVETTSADHTAHEVLVAYSDGWV